MLVCNVSCSFYSLSSFHPYYFFELSVSAFMPSFSQDVFFYIAIPLWLFGYTSIYVYSKNSTYAKNGVSENRYYGVPIMYIIMGTWFRNIINTRGAVQWLILDVNTPLPVSMGFKVQNFLFLQITNCYFLKLYKSHVKSQWMSPSWGYLWLHNFLCILIQESISSEWSRSSF